MAKKSAKYEKEQRIEEVRKMMVNGTSRADIIGFAKKKWKISERTVDWYIAQAREKNLEVLGESQYKTLALAVDHRRLLRSEAHERGDYRLEFKVAKDEAQLLGLYNIFYPPKPTRKKKPGISIH